MVLSFELSFNHILAVILKNLNYNTTHRATFAITPCTITKLLF